MIETPTDDSKEHIEEVKEECCKHKGETVTHEQAKTGVEMQLQAAKQDYRAEARRVRQIIAATITQSKTQLSNPESEYPRLLC